MGKACIVLLNTLTLPQIMDTETATDGIPSDNTDR